MAYLIEQLFGWLLIVAILCALSGWAYHALRNSLQMERLVGERDKLQRDLVGLVMQDLPAGDGPLTVAAAREAEMLRAQLDVANARAEDLERQNQLLRDRHEDLVAEMAGLRRQLETEPATVVAEPVAPQLAVGGGLSGSEKWRLRYYEARTAHLEALAQGALGAVPDTAGIDAELNAARARIAELEARLAAPVANPFLDENNRLAWHVRYLEGRVKYLETLPPAAPPVPLAPPIDPEAEEDSRRREWRMRYLEARLAHLDGLREQTDAAAAEARALQARAAAAEAGLAEARQALAQSEAAANTRAQELEALLAEAERERDLAIAAARRASELEAELARLAAAPKPAADTGKIRWRTRYLEARVAHLEASLGSAAANRPLPPQPVAAPVAAAHEPAPPPPPPKPELAPAPAPARVEQQQQRLAPFSAEVRPEGLSAPRGGAPDDLRLIEGVGPKLESTLNSLGIFHFDQIAAWTPANVAWVDQYLRFRGRIVRERWIEQAAELAVDGGASARALLQEQI